MNKALQIYTLKMMLWKDLKHLVNAFELIDFEAEVDSKLTLSENYTIIYDKYVRLK